MTNGQALAAALRGLADRVDDLDPARVVGELEALKFTIWTANVSAPANEKTADEWLTDVSTVATIAHRSVSWVQKNGHTLPGFSQPGRKGTKRTWSRRALEAWASTPST